jgi:hypothetical protein
MEVIFGWLGLLGGILTATGDVLLDLKGRDNKKLGRYKFMESAWDTIAVWRFRTSILLAAAGVPLYFLGLTSLAMQMTNAVIALTFWLVCLSGAIGGFFIHALICLFPILYKKMRENRPFDEIETALNTMYDAVKIPFYLQFVLLVFGSSLLYIVAIIMGYLALPVWTVTFTPLCLMIAGILLRILKRDWFYDLPGIIMPSMGLGLLGLLAVINSILAA